MEEINELRISPWPWIITETAVIVSKHGEVISGQYGPYNWHNAHLIAAAPELYECLREAVVESCIAYCGEHPIVCRKQQGECFVQKWRSALAKASGGDISEGKKKGGSE